MPDRPAHEVLLPQPISGEHHFTTIRSNGVKLSRQACFTLRADKVNYNRDPRQAWELTLYVHEDFDISGSVPLCTFEKALLAVWIPRHWYCNLRDLCLHTSKGELELRDAIANTIMAACPLELQGSPGGIQFSFKVECHPFSYVERNADTLDSIKPLVRSTVR